MDKRWWLFAFCCVGLFVVVSTDVGASASILLGWFLHPNQREVVLNPFFENVTINPGYQRVNGSFCLWNNTVGWECISAWTQNISINLTGFTGSFTSLNDTPDVYTGFNGSCVVVNSTETGLAFVNCSTGGGSFNNSFFFNNTVATFDGAQGGYSGADALCNAEFAGTHLCSKEEMLTTMHYKALPADWSGEAWINSGAANGYHIGNPTNDCFGWKSNSATDYLGGWWDFQTGYSDAASWLINCGELKSLACCKVY